MRYQITPHYCGPASLQNALRCVGVIVGQHKLAAMCGTTDEGTDEYGLLTAAAGFAVETSTICAVSGRDAINAVDTGLGLGPVILCVEQWGHWVCLIGKVGARYILSDPARTEVNKAEAGVQVLTRKALLRKWSASRRTRENGPEYYGIAIRPVTV